MRTSFVAVAVLAVGGPLSACDLVTRTAANESAAVSAHAATSLESHWDTELVGDGLPATILQLEGLYSVVPDNESLGLQLAQAYAFYAYGWVDEEAEDAFLNGNLEGEAEARVRARLLYERSRNVALHHLRAHDAGLDRAIAEGPDALRAHLRTHFAGREHASRLFWVGYPWAGAIQQSQGDPDLVLEVSTARAFVEVAVELDEGVFHHAGLVMLGALQASFSTEMGGNPDAGRALFERALERTGRRFFAVQLAYAQTYAVTTNDRALFVSLLREIIDGGDPDPANRLANRLARRKAIRLLRRIDEFFSA